MKYTELRKAAFDSVLAAGLQHIKTICEHIDQDRLTWRSAPVPRPEAMRAFEGSNADYKVIVTQCNIVDVGVKCEGMAVATRAGLMLIKLPPAVADYAYHKAAARQN